MKISRFVLTRFLLLVVLVGVLPKQGFTRDVYAVDEAQDEYVKVTKVDDKSVRFELCYKDESFSCALLGGKDSYTLDQLESLKKTINTRGAGLVVADVAIAAGLAALSGITGGFVGHALAADAALNVNTVVGAVIGAGVGVAGGMTLAVLVKTLNPLNQFRKAKVLREEVITDGDVKVEDFYQFVEYLDDALSEL